MAAIDAKLVMDALRATGVVLAKSDDPLPGPVRLVLAGGVAGMLNQSLPAARTTADCDVIEETPEGIWGQLEQAASLVAEKLGLPTGWLSNECRIYRYRLPLGWSDRVLHVGVFGPLEIDVLGRLDLLCLKITSARRRPQDRQDLRDMEPTAEEVEFAQQHLDRLEAEDLLDQENTEWERAFLESLLKQRDEDD